MKIIKNSSERRKIRTRKKLSDNKGLPRFTVFRSNRYLWAQIIDDKKGLTLLSSTTKTLPETKEKLTKTQEAQKLGEIIAKKALKLKITRVRFDKGPYRFHGRVKALAQSARKSGLKF